MKILITGANGFIGRALSKHLVSLAKYSVVGTCRKPSDVASDIQMVSTGEVDGNTGWDQALQGVDTVIHLAARAHVLDAGSEDPVLEFERINVQGAVNLAQQAVKAGVRRFIFISSIGVNGSETHDGAFTESDEPKPHAEYARSKLKAERELSELLAGETMELIVIRPPLVYAAEAPGNFNRLLKLIATGVPLPFAAVENKRSMIALENLVDFIELCIGHPSAANELFLVSDGTDFSISEIINLLALGMGRKERLFRVPDALIRSVASAVGKRSLYTQLCRSLVVDNKKSRALLNWAPARKAHDALVESGERFRLL
ncbi:UDP-glucose 4-epimerase [Pseudomonas sp. R4-35-07]|uniref:NAD-dependent epimerase/dehydratase family protein n=1 Tax=unclassified Pseudomonas TaxID=196821 RepID=UPI000F56193F|nr:MULTISPECIES: NAD-dependent epimerase/dehydratase family protein [unclassified Pseudomonas]AZF20410.1 UDP-glucose 4-epimerase [Pseudomonas sp. R3-52-08]AZF31109.1 UDP-glucose 4-epimerase [Pseudomonas sp. R4-35-07]